MHARGLGADEQRFRDLAVGTSLGDQCEHLALAIGEVEAIAWYGGRLFAIGVGADVDSPAARERVDLLEKEARADRGGDRTGLAQRLPRRCRPGTRTQAGIGLPESGVGQPELASLPSPYPRGRDPRLRIVAPLGSRQLPFDHVDEPRGRRLVFGCRLGVAHLSELVETVPRFVHRFALAQRVGAAPRVVGSIGATRSCDRQQRDDAAERAGRTVVENADQTAVVSRRDCELGFSHSRVEEARFDTRRRRDPQSGERVGRRLQVAASRLQRGPRLEPAQIVEADGPGAVDALEHRLGFVVPAQLEQTVGGIETKKVAVAPFETVLHRVGGGARRELGRFFESTDGFQDAALVDPGARQVGPRLGLAGQFGGEVQLGPPFGHPSGVAE